MGGKKNGKRRPQRPPDTTLRAIAGWQMDVGLTVRLAAESDRGCVLVAAAAVDEEVSNLLRAFFRKASSPDDRSEEVHFLIEKRPVPPLGSFGVRVLLCFVLGLIDRKTYDALDGIGAVRNIFAHSHDRVEIQLADAPALIFMSEAEYASRYRTTFGALMEYGHQFGDPRPFSEARCHFMGRSAALYLGLLDLTKLVGEDKHGLRLPINQTEFPPQSEHGP